MSDSQLEPRFPLQENVSKLSRHFQRGHYGLVLTNLGLLVAAAGAEVLNFSITSYPKTCFLVAGLGATLLIKRLAFDKKWYAARSLSETLKSLKWRFVMGALPFEGSETENASTLFDRIESAYRESNSAAGVKLFVTSDKEAKENIALLVSILPYRFENYLKYRFSVQQRWYRSMFRRNKSLSLVFFSILVLSNSLAIIFSAWQESGMQISVSPTGLFTALATALVGWIEAKRYSELSTAYLLTYNEIVQISKSIHNILDDNEITEFVLEAESLFSREHTQWAAKRGFMTALSK